MTDGASPVGSPAGPNAGQEPAAGDSARELLIRELGAILAGWGISQEDDETLGPLADTVAALLTPGPAHGA